MRHKRLRRFAVAAFTLSVMGLAGCENTQGTASDPDMIKETVAYKDNDDPQNTGAGAGTANKPPQGPTSSMGGESASQAAAKGTGPANDPK